MYLILQNDIERFKLKFEGGKVTSKKSILWSEMGSSIKFKLHGFTPEQLIKSKTWPLMGWTMNILTKSETI